MKTQKEIWRNTNGNLKRSIENETWKGYLNEHESKREGNLNMKSKMEMQRNIKGRLKLYRAKEDLKRNLKGN